MRLLRLVLLFGTGAIALALILAPIADRYSRQRVVIADLPDGLDMNATGSVSHAGRYVLRKSVLQASPASVCEIHQNGARIGDCD